MTTVSPIAAQGLPGNGYQVRLRKIASRRLPFAALPLLCRCCWLLAAGCCCHCCWLCRCWRLAAGCWLPLLLLTSGYRTAAAAGWHCCWLIHLCCTPCPAWQWIQNNLQYTTGGGGLTQSGQAAPAVGETVISLTLPLHLQ